MTLFLILLNLGIFLSTLLIGGSLLYFKSYLTQKANNTATKEDIGKITRSVEEIKNEFAKDNEKLKSQLAIITNKYNSIFIEEKEALHIYLSTWNVWYGMLV